MKSVAPNNPVRVGVEHSMSRSAKGTKPTVQLIGLDGNAYGIIWACRGAWLEAGLNPNKWESIRAEIQAGDYNHLLVVITKYFEVK